MSAAVLANVKVFCTSLPSSSPRVLLHVSSRIIGDRDELLGRKADRVSAAEVHWRDQVIAAAIPGTSTPVNLANATATAAIVPVWMTRKIAQPNRNPNAGP